MDNLIVRAGARLTFYIERVDDDAISAKFFAKNDTHEIEKTVDYDEDGIALFEIESPDTDNVGEYEYQVSELFETGSPDIYAGAGDDDCDDDDDCGFPTLTICESLEYDEDGS